MYITIRPSLEKIKAWHKVKDAEALYNSLIANRAIDPADLDIYKVTCGSNQLLEKNNYELIENDTKIELKNLKVVVEDTIDTLAWNELAPEERERLYDDTEKADIEFNLNEPDDTTWREVPDRFRNGAVESIDTEIIQTICIEKLNPFT